MKPLPLISVLLTSYNRERYIAESIESVLAQTCRNFELIITDNCSTDGTQDIVSSYARRDDRIRASVNGHNLGQFGNRRHALTLARGRFVKYHDSDDVMYPHCLAAMADPLMRDHRAAFALSGDRGWPGGPSPMLVTPRLAYEREFLGSGLFQLGPACAIFRADALRELGGFPDEGVASDYLFWLRACARVNVLLVSGDLFYYRVHPGQEYENPKNQVEYARAFGEAWRMLNSSECPLTGAALQQAKRNFAFGVVRRACRHLNAGQFQLALSTVRHADLSAGEWFRYLRRSHRTNDAGTADPEFL